MQSLKELYRIGRGPSSSHTMGPEFAAKFILSKYPDADSFSVTLFGSLALTGKGHGTDVVLKSILGRNTPIIFNTTETNLPHPNTFDISVIKDGNVIDCRRILSVGGGAIKIQGEPELSPAKIYPHNSFDEIKSYCNDNDMSLYDYVIKFEGTEIIDFLEDIWTHMKDSVKRGLKSTGILPGGLNIQRKAKYLYSQTHIDESPETREHRLVCSYAFAVAEENAAGGIIVTAPTCGASGVLPATLYYMSKRHNFPDSVIIRALAVGGIVGNLIKTNASISGAECGCQAEIGSACSMASAALGELFSMKIEQIEYAAEIAIEHHLGLTCDPVCGLVQIPCIERNAVAAMRALNALSLANFLSDTREISLDLIIKTMYETGRDLSQIYRETSTGGLAKLYIKKKI
ncbi:MAG: L-serine ammonia-lyase, iron-sulfur-dependent, subunit alpha [Clostridia bacterium]